jgi:hypothetical protein
VAQECPAGTGTKIGLIFGAVVLFIAGIAVFASRGGRATEPGLPSAATIGGPDWSNLGGTRPPKPSAPPARPTVFTNRDAANAQARPVAPPSPPVTAAGAGGDPVERLEQLSELRAKGAVTEAEFEAAKVRILREL